MGAADVGCYGCCAQRFAGSASLLCFREYPKYTPSPIANQIANRTHVYHCRNVTSQSDAMTPMIGITGMNGSRNWRSRSGCR